MPSLLNYTNPQGVNVAANYGRIVPQHTYGAQGTNYTNFGTRNLRFVRITLSGAGAGANDLTKGADGATGTYADSLSLFSVAVRALQTVAEVWGVFTPDATSFVAVLSDDTMNDSDVDSNVAGGYGDLEAVVKSNLLGSTTTVTAEKATIAGSTFTWA
jgi:hypothetical protein